MTIADSCAQITPTSSCKHGASRHFQPVEHFLAAVGLGVLGYVFTVYAISELLLAIGHPVTGPTVWIALLLSAAPASVIAAKARLAPAWAACAGLSAPGIVLALVGVSMLFYDASWDGIAYHQEAVLQLASGWNPLRTSVSDSNVHALWINHYPKFSWIFGANHYLAFGNIESGKCYSLLLATSMMLLSVPALRKYWSSNWWWSLAMALLLAANPVLINQVFTYYVDGLLYVNFVLTCLAAFYAISERQPWWYLVFGIAGVLLVNTKFTGVPYFCLLAAAVAIYLLIYRSLREAVTFSAIAAVALLVALLIFGFDTYVKNTLDHGHPLYPLYGAGSIEIMGAQSPTAFEGLSLLHKFFASIFNVVSNDREAVLHPRLPFLLHSRGEMRDSVGHDVRLSGFGFWFSGVFVASIAAIVLAGLSRARRFSRAKACFIIVALLATVLVNPAAWWARYVPQLWLLPLIAILLLQLVVTTQARVAAGLLMAAMFINSGVIARGVLLSNVAETTGIHAEFSRLRASPAPVPVHFGIFPALRARLRHDQVPFTTVPDDEPLQCAVSRVLAGSHGQTRYCAQ